MRLRCLNFFIGLLVTVVGAGSVWHIAQAATASGNLNVTLTIPSNNSGCVGCVGVSGGGDEFPKITNVVSSTSASGVNFSWTATDDKQLATTTFSYGPTSAYGFAGTVTGAAPNFQIALSGLAANALYYFRIAATDNINQTAQFLATFHTAGFGPDITPPVISNRSVTIGITTTSVAWDTNEPADSQVNYGASPSYGHTALDNNLILQHAFLLFNLLPNTSYHYRIVSADSSGNSAATADATFTTLKDAAPPPDVSSFSLITKPSSFILNWTNPDPTAVPDFSGVKIVRTVNAPASAVNDSAGTIVYSGPGETVTDNNVVANRNYYYTVFSFDTSGNYSPGTYQNGAFVPPAGVEVCNNGLDDNNDGLIDCADPQCVAAPSCQAPGAEICDNGIDDDNNGLIDCADSICAKFPACVFSTSTTTPPVVVTTPQTVYTPPPTTVAESKKVVLTDFNFLAGAGNIALTPSADGTVISLTGSPLIVTVPGVRLASLPKSLALVIDGNERHQFNYNKTADIYNASVSFPNAGTHQAYLEITYSADRFDSVGVKFLAQPFGQITASGGPLGDTELILYNAAGAVFPAASFGQTNPVVSSANGSFGWVVPNGQYFLVAKKDGFYERSTPVITVTNNVYNASVTLVAEPTKPAEVVTAAFQLGAQSIADTVTILREKSHDPGVQNTAATVVAPAVVSAVAVGTATLISWANLLPLARLLFLQPLLLLGRRKREGWGQVYNALNKLPVDLAILRLINADTGKVVQTKVSDKKGRYAFVATPGNYRIEAVKNNLLFPSLLLGGLTADGTRTDIYHGEIIKVSEDNAVLTANVPLDPLGEFKKPVRIFWARVGRFVQLALSWIGLGITAVSFYLAPRWYVGVLFAAHAGLFLLFRRLALPAKIKSWGIVYSAADQQPVGRVIARLFNLQFNKLVDTQITDPRGRYYFLAGDSQYYVTYEKPSFAPHQTGTIDLSGKEAENIAVDVRLHPQSSGPINQAGPPFQQ